MRIFAALFVFSIAAAHAQPSATPQDDTADPRLAQFAEKKQFFRVAQPEETVSPRSGTVEVVDVFWYGCPHCNAFRPSLGRWLESKGDTVKVAMLPAGWNAITRLHAKAYFTAQALGVLEQMHDEFFEEIHTRKNALDSEPLLVTFFARFGVDANKFAATFNSPEIAAGLERGDALFRRYGIRFVPALVINGKYVVDVHTAGSYEAMIEIADVLAASETARAR